MRWHRWFSSCHRLDTPSSTVTAPFLSPPKNLAENLCHCHLALMPGKTTTSIGDCCPISSASPCEALVVVIGTVVFASIDISCQRLSKGVEKGGKLTRHHCSFQKSVLRKSFMSVLETFRRGDGKLILLELLSNSLTKEGAISDEKNVRKQLLAY